eukprot:406756-Prorocentrum_minimum.AAC.1
MHGLIFETRLLPLSRPPPPFQGMRKTHNSFGIHVASGNYVAAKRHGVVSGIDFGETGEGLYGRAEPYESQFVRYVDTQSIRQQLNLNNVVVLSNLGYSSAGEVLNCHTYEVRPPTQTYRKR